MKSTVLAETVRLCLGWADEDGGTSEGLGGKV
jgi:hypothetical protein